MSKKNIIFIEGIPDDKKISVTKIQKDGSFDCIKGGSSNLMNFLKTDAFNSIGITFDTAVEQELPQLMIHGVFNEISDPDSNHITLEKLENLRKSAPANIPFFNLPADVMKTTRDNIYQLLQGIDKLHVPKTVRIQPKSPSDIYDAIKKEGLEFPVIFRQAGDHGGKSTIRIDDDGEQFYPFALDGRDYYLTQFVDYVDEKGVYAKYRLTVVNGEVFLRHVIFGKEWMVHARSQLPEKESKILKGKVAKNFNQKIKPEIAPIITEIHKRLNMDYFGIDCNIDQNMNILVFEINASMNQQFHSITKNSVFFKHTEAILNAIIQMISLRIDATS